MKLIFGILLTLTCLFFSSCATIFSGSKAKVTLDSDVRQPVNLRVDGQGYDNVILPRVIKVKRGFNESVVTAETAGYPSTMLTIDKEFNPVAILNLTDVVGWGIDAATGAMMKPENNYYTLYFGTKTVSSPTVYDQDPTIRAGEAQNMVNRDAPGQTALERTIVRWYFDSAPRGARIFWRIISSIPDQVKNTNELYLSSTPFEETRSLIFSG